MLNDTRTSTRRSGDISLGAEDDERQFLVGKDDEDEDEHDRDRELEHRPEDDVQSFRSSASMDMDGPSREAERSNLRNLGTSMVNDEARMSHLDVHVVSPIDGDDGYVPEAHSGSLAAKAGVILVSLLMFSYENEPECCSYTCIDVCRAFIMYSSSCLNLLSLLLPRSSSSSLSLG